MRILKIHLAMKDSPLPRSIKQVLPMFGNESKFAYVESAAEADLIIFTDVKEIEKGYSKEKQYAFFKVSGQASNMKLPENCATIDFLHGMIPAMLKLIEEAHAKIQGTAETPAVAAVKPAAAPLRSDALRILVIDDTPKHIESAKSGLAGHRLTAVTGYQDAMSVLGSEKFDVVLTDLHLPMSSQTMGEKFRLGELVPYGVLLMVEAARQGAKHVAVVTDLNHHDDPFSAAFDHYSRFPVQIESAKVVMMHAPMADGAKDWAAALEQLTKTS